MENDYLQKSFDENFIKYRNEPISIYGIGVNARKLLKNIHGYNFACVIADEKIGEIFEGYIISSLKEAVKKSRIIIIAATCISTAMVYERIKERIPKHVCVYDMRGTPLKISGGVRKRLSEAAENVSDCKVLEALMNCVQLEEKGGKVQFNDIDILSNVCFIGITMQYMSYIISCAKLHSEANLLFVSRDGYFLQKLYENIRSDYDPSLPRSIYFYTSRQSVTQSMLVDDEAIVLFFKTTLPEMGNANLKKFLSDRLCIEVGEEFDYSVDHVLKKYGWNGLFKMFFPYKEELIQKSEIKKQNYLSYIKKNNIDSCKEIVLVDLVTRGTGAYGLQKILNRDVILISLGAFKYKNSYTYNDRISKVYSLYGDITIYSRLVPFFAHLERIYSSREGQVIGFSAEGEPIFNEDARYNEILLECSQKVISKFIAGIHGKWYQNILSSNFSLTLLEMLREEYSVISPDVIEMFEFYEPTIDRKVNQMKDIRIL